LRFRLNFRSFFMLFGTFCRHFCENRIFLRPHNQVWPAKFPFLWLLLTADDREKFIFDNQWAFKYGLYKYKSSSVVMCIAPHFATQTHTTTPLTSPAIFDIKRKITVIQKIFPLYLR
jgi:hypothetical protein